MRAMPIASAPTQPLSAEERFHILTQLQEPAAWLQVAAIALSLLLAWWLVRLLRGQRPIDPRGIWFGEKVIDGALFPMVALGLTWVSRSVMLALHEPVLMFRLALPVLLSFTLIRITARALRAAFPTSSTAQMAERSVSWVAWVMVVLWITGVLPVVMAELDQITWRIGTANLTLLNIIEAALSVGVVLILTLSVSSTIESHLLKGAGDNLSGRKMAATIIRAALLTLGMMLALSSAGVDLTTLSVLGGAVGVGVGLGLQKLASNYVSGFVILAERSLRIGDLVKVDNFEGRITDIKTRYTVVRAANGREAIIPNETLITSRVENASLADSSLLLTLTVQVAYGTDFLRAKAALIEGMTEHPRIMAAPGPDVAMSAFQADGIELTLLFWLRDPENGQLSVRSDMHQMVLRVFDELGVEIPYPQRVIRQGPTA